jgi:hypothetical protein
VNAHPESSLIMRRSIDNFGGAGRGLSGLLLILGAFLVWQSRGTEALLKKVGRKK